MKTKTFRAIMIALLLAATPTLALNLITTTNVYATEDVTPPVLNDIWASPSTVNDGESVTIHVDVTDDISGVYYVTGSLQSPTGNQRLSFWSPYNPSSNPIEITVTIPEYSEAGIWTIDYVGCGDKAQNHKGYYYGTDYTADFTVNSLTPDTTPPTLNDIWASPSTVNDGESVTIHVDVTDDISGVYYVTGSLQSPTGNQRLSFWSPYNPSSNPIEITVTIPEYSEAGIWTIDYVGCGDKAQNHKGYYYGTDYTADFTVNSVPVGDIWSSDVLGDVKDSFAPGESVYVTVPEAGLTVSLYVVADKSAWNDGDSLTDVSLDGVETLTLNSGQGTQTIQIWGAPLTPGNYDIVMDVDRDGVFDAELDCVDDMEITGFFVVPEVPLGTIMGSLSMFAAFVAFVGFKRSRQKSQS